MYVYVCVCDCVTVCACVCMFACICLLGCETQECEVRFQGTHLLLPKGVATMYVRVKGTLGSRSYSPRGHKECNIRNLVGTVATSVLFEVGLPCLSATPGTIGGTPISGDSAGESDSIWMASTGETVRNGAWSWPSVLAGDEGWLPDSPPSSSNSDPLPSSNSSIL